jgi:trimethylamine--corrinoid protein Co-methyltransferase
MGASTPVTLAGAVTLNLAEQLALRILDWALNGSKRLHLGTAVSVMDMRTTIRPYGRPEMVIANVMMAQLARHYGASFSGQAGLSDAKLPSVEAGVQKAMSAIPTLLAGGAGWVAAGLLSIDEVCSPIQMVLDNEFLSVLKRFIYDFSITEESIGVEMIIQVGPGGTFLDQTHTVRHFRQEHWEPTIWSRQMLGPWLEDGCHLDVDKARDVVLAFHDRKVDQTNMPDWLEREVLNVIDRAKKALINR